MTKTVSIMTLIGQFLKQGDDLQATTLALIKQAKTMSYPAYVKACADVVSRKYKVEAHPSRKGGLPTFAKDTAAEQRLTALRKLHAGYNASKFSSKREPVVVNKRKVAQVVALAQGMSREEFNAFLSAVRAAVVFVK